MGLRFRKSIKILPGVKMNIGKKSVGFSAGVKGARVSVNSKGRVTKSVGIPGTGLSYVDTKNIKSKNNTANNSDGGAPSDNGTQKKKTGCLIKFIIAVIVIGGLGSCLGGGAGDQTGGGSTSASTSASASTSSSANAE